MTNTTPQNLLGDLDSGASSYLGGGIVRNTLGYAYNGTYLRFGAVGALTDGKKHDVLITHAVTGEIAGYIDGVLQTAYDENDNVVASPSAPYSTTLTKWSGVFGGDGNGHPFTGLFAAEIVINGAMSALDAVKFHAWSNAHFSTGRQFVVSEVFSIAQYYPSDGAAVWAMSDGTLIRGFGWRAVGHEFPNDGVDGDGTNNVTNSVWASTNAGGAPFTNVLPYSGAPAATQPVAQHAAPYFRHTAAGTEYAYLMDGGHPGVSTSASWSTKIMRSTNGITWSTVLATAPWMTGGRTPRVGSFAFSLGGKLYHMGGQTDFTNPLSCVSDVDVSTDHGATWTRLTDAPWASRGWITTVAVDEANGVAYVIGGGRYFDGGTATTYNDVWKFDPSQPDGSMWTQVLANGHSQWSGALYHATLFWKGLLVIIGGARAGSVNASRIVWSSDGGVTWHHHWMPGITASHADGVDIDPITGKIVVAVGNGSIDLNRSTVWNVDLV